MISSSRHNCYGGTCRLLGLRAARRQFEVAFVDQNDPIAIEAAFERIPALVLIETPSNPLMRVVDISEIARRAKTVGAEVAVDNTFLSPALQQPITLGADFVIHSTTKYLNGHSDVIGGAVVAAKEKDAEDQQRVDYDDSERFSPAGRGGSEESDDLPCRRSTEWDGGRRSMMITDQHHVPPQITVPCSDFRDK